MGYPAAAELGFQVRAMEGAEAGLIDDELALCWLKRVDESVSLRMCERNFAESRQLNESQSGMKLQ